MISTRGRLGKTSLLPVTSRGRLDRNQSSRPIHESFLVYKKGRYIIQAALLGGGAGAAYLFHNPWDGASGGTWLGYALGTIGAILIVWLTLLGVRKRIYRSVLGTVEGWLSAHVYFGAILFLIATLHTGGKVHNNIHGAAYLLMCLVIVTGFYGVYAYRRYPTLMLRSRDGLSRKQLLQKIAALDGQCELVAQKLGEEVLTVMRSAVERTVVGGSWWQLVRQRDRSKVALPEALGIGVVLRPNPDQKTIIQYLTDRFGGSGGAEETLWLQELIDLCAKRRGLLEMVRTDLRRQ